MSSKKKTEMDDIKAHCRYLTNISTGATYQKRHHSTLNSHGEVFFPEWAAQNYLPQIKP
jgi:hypothetical protein